MIHGDYAAFVRDSGVDSVTQYELWKAIWSSLNDGNFFELAWALDRHNRLLDSFVPQTFIGNHDVTRIASRLAEPDLSRMRWPSSSLAADALDLRRRRTGVSRRQGAADRGDDVIRPPFRPRPPSLRRRDGRSTACISN